MLILPAESGPAVIAGSFVDRNLNELTAHARGLRVGDGENGVAVDALDEPIAKCVEGSAEGGYFVTTQYALLN